MSNYERDREDELGDEAMDATGAMGDAWRGMTPPPAHRELDAEDAATRASVEWAKSAYLAAGKGAANVAPSDATQGEMAPELGRADEASVLELDPKTAATVRWMRQAFAQQNIPAAQSPAATNAAPGKLAALAPAALNQREAAESNKAPSHGPARLRLLPTLVAGLAAASLLAYLIGPGASLFSSSRQANHTEQPVEVALGPDVTETGSPEGVSSPTIEADVPDLGITTDIVDGRIEMRSGSVRLQLFSAGPPTTNEIEALGAPTSGDTLDGLSTDTTPR